VKTVTVFAALDADVQVQKVDPSAKKADMTLPTELAATIGGQDETIAGVTWQCAGYDDETGMTEGEYVRTPVLPEGYTLDLGTDEFGQPVTPPSILARVVDAEGAEDEPVTVEADAPTQYVRRLVHPRGGGHARVYRHSVYKGHHHLRKVDEEAKTRPRPGPSARSHLRIPHPEGWGHRRYPHRLVHAQRRAGGGAKPAA